MNKFFTWFGDAQNRIESKINSSYLPTKLTEEVIIERGIEFFYEIIFYTVIFSIPCIEIIRTSLER